jgi:hypothetical protein
MNNDADHNTDEGVNSFEREVKPYLCADSKERGKEEKSHFPVGF